LSCDTARVAFTLVSLRPVTGGGKLLALADVAVEIGGVEFLIRGARLARVGNGCGVSPPAHKDAAGRFVPTLTLPEEIRQPIADLVWAAYQALAPRPVCSIAPMALGSECAITR
jgi:stage V sporulation protein G